MKKWMIILTGMLIAAGSAQAGCGTCEATESVEGHKHEMKKGLEKEHTHGKKMKNKAECDAADAKYKAACEAGKAKEKGKKCLDGTKKPAEECTKEAKDNALEQAQTQRKKWWKFGFGK